MGETPLVNCGPRSYSLHSIQSTAIVFYCFVGAKYFDFVVQIPRWRRNACCCAASHFATINLQRASWLLLVRLNLGFFLRENLLLCASYLPLGVPNERVSYTPSSIIFWRRCRGDQDTLQGESPLLNLFTLFLSCFILFTTLFAAPKQNTKKLVASFTIFTVLLSISKTQKN